jgi:hypothetical protein
MTSPRTVGDLLPSERTLVMAMQHLGFGRLECLQIHTGKPVLDPWPKTIRATKFGSDHWETAQARSDEFELKRQVLELIEYIRSTAFGEILRLEIKYGLPFSMEVEFRCSPDRRSL